MPCTSWSVGIGTSARQSCQPLQPDSGANADAALQHPDHLVSCALRQVEGYITQHLAGGLLIPGADRGVKSEERSQIDRHCKVVAFPQLAMWLRKPQWLRMQVPE